MILYTVVPMEIIFENCNENKAPLYTQIDYLGQKIIVSPLSEDEYVIQRIIGTSPKSFLDPRLQPGKIIRKIIAP